MRNSYFLLVIANVFFFAVLADAQDRGDGWRGRRGDRGDFGGGGFGGGGFGGGGFGGGGFPGGGYGGGGFGGGGYPGGGFGGGGWGGGGPGGGGWGGGGPGGGGWGGGGPGGSGWGGGSREERMAGFFAQIDANHDGQIDAGEIQAAGPRAGMVEGLIRRSGMEPKYPIKISSIQEAMQNARGNWNRGGPGGGPPGGNPGGPPAGGNSKPAANAAPLVPGFGVEQKIQPIRGFDGTPIQPGIVAASSPAAGGAPSSPAVPAGAPEQIDDRTRKFAESILRQNDKDHSGALEKNKGEWDEVRKKNEIDKDHNDVITLDELTVYYQALNGSRGPRRNDPGGGGFPGSPPPNSAPQGGATYRIRSPLERLPEGLPDWFARNDANADGQVSMAEFTTSWSAEKAKEFARCDLNGDGIVTPQECLRSAPKK